MLTERERKNLELAAKGLSDYKIARELHTDAPSATRSRKNALRKLKEAEEAIAWAQKLGYPEAKKLRP